MGRVSGIRIQGQARAIRLLLLFGMALLILCAPVRALDAGAAACDITPDTARYKVPMAGYGAREGKPSTGMRDPLRAKVLYFRDGERSMALITSDLRSVTPAFKQQAIAKAAVPGLTEENVLVCASHNHSGPSIYSEKFWQLQFGVYDPAVVEAMSDAVAGALQAAAKSAAPVRVGFNEGMAEGFSKNRRWEYDTAAREVAGETPAVNTRVWVMRIDGLDGMPKATFVHFATHPTILGADNFELSAEWPGVLQRTLESAYPGAIAMYANGAEGDQAPDGATGADAFARADDFGTRLGAIAVELLKAAKTGPDLSIAYAYTPAPLGEPVFSEGSRRGPYAFMEPMAMEALPRFAVLQQFRIGPVVLAGLPGEAICEVGLATEEGVRKAGASTAIAIGLANDYIGYILNEKEYRHGGYEVDSRSYYGPGLGKLIAEKTAKSAAGMFATGE